MSGGYVKGWDPTCGGIVQPTHYTAYEGGLWLEWPSAARIGILPRIGIGRPDAQQYTPSTHAPRFYSLRFRCGAEWDVHNGWRSVTAVDLRQAHRESPDTKQRMSDISDRHDRVLARTLFPDSETQYESPEYEIPESDAQAVVGVGLHLDQHAREFFRQSRQYRNTKARREFDALMGMV